MNEDKEDANYPADDTVVILPIIESLKARRILQEVAPPLLDGILGDGFLRNDIVKKVTDEIYPPFLYSYLSYLFLGEEGIKSLTSEVSEEEINEFLKKVPQRYQKDMERCYKRFPENFAIFKLSIIMAQRHLEKGYIEEIKRNEKKERRFTEKGLIDAIIDFYCWAIYYKVKKFLEEGYIAIITREPETVLKPLLKYLIEKAPKALENAVMGYRGGNKLDYVVLKKTEELRNALGIPPEKFQQVVTIVIPSADDPINFGFLGCPEEKKKEVFIDTTAELLSYSIESRIRWEIRQKERKKREEGERLSYMV
jgi:hypothetical protein